MEPSTTAFSELSSTELVRRLEAQNHELAVAHQKLEASRAEYAELYEQAPVGYVNLDPSGVIVDANAAAVAFFGHHRSLLIGAPFAAAARIKDKAAFRASVRHCAASREKVVSEVECITPDGGTLVLQLVSIADRVSCGDVTGFRLELTDLTAVRQVRVDKALLANERRARREADEANRMKDQFLGIVSHELRTPLNAILGWTQMAQLRDYDRDLVQRAVGVMERNAKALARIVDDILDVSRIVNGKLHVELTKTDFTEVTRAALDLARPSAVAKGVNLGESLAEECSMRGDPGRLEQVVTNLLSNAIKFTRPGGDVQVTLVRAGALLRLSVSDDGCGIEAKDLPHVFESFRQADSSTTRSHSGLGLGLAIAQHIVLAHGGEIAACSKGCGMGTTVTIALPAASFTTPPPRPAYRPAAAEAPVSIAGIKVLFVDDEPAARELAELMLGVLGAIVETAGSVEGALERVARLAPDVVVSDIAMPERDGLDLIRAIRALPPPVGQVPAIALTAYARAEDVQHALAAGFTTHLPKPAGTEPLAAMIAQLVHRPRGT
jgi:PAS domain S-box-containing protein